MVVAAALTRFLSNSAYSTSALSTVSILNITARACRGMEVDGAITEEACMRHIERHRTQRIGWLRAAVLGANDGIVSTASLVLGVAAAGGEFG